MHADKRQDCLFCSLSRRKGKEESWIVFRGEHWYVLLNTYPYSSGHLMVVCNRHLESFAQLSAEENRELTELLARSEGALKRAFHPDGINMGANLGKTAGAGIEGHLHVHMVPRWQGDTNFMTTVGETRVISEDLAETYRKLKGIF